MELRKLKTLYIVKGTIAAILILLAIAFAIALFEATDPGGAQPPHPSHLPLRG